MTLATLGVWGAAVGGIPPNAPAAETFVVFGFNDLGMHCMNQDFSKLCILPPANFVHAQVVRRGESPEVMTSDVTVRYSMPGNTKSSTKTNFWKYDVPLFGVDLPNDIGLFGTGLSGKMAKTGNGDFWAPGIPITPLLDTGRLDPYQLAKIQVTFNGSVVASAQPVVPVSWEIRCDLCHGGATLHPEIDILKKHDAKHGTNLINQQPVLCAKCHADPALGAPGAQGVSTLSSAMHASHATRMAGTKLANACYACHPGPQTQCLRDNHSARGMNCNSCHGSMAMVGDPSRVPWRDNPKCGDCHNVPGHEYEEPGKLFKESKGHGGILCASCHGSPHAITPSTNPRDNVQAIAKQGYAGTINKCTVCHTKQPEHAFFHRRDDD
ncbi:MAG: hypothetical protein HZC36_05940 [Armatimonadetes bacterium]|nr:hypothetical protein [Armatimonadota bacterium]